VATAHRISARLRPFRLLVVGALTAVAALAAPMTATSAAPQLTLGQVLARIDALNTQAEKITEAYDAARDQLVVIGPARAASAVSAPTTTTRNGRRQAEKR